MVKYLLKFLILICIVVAFIGIYSYYKLTEKVSAEQAVFVNLPKAATFNQVIKVFNSKELFKPKWFFKPVIRVYAYVTHSRLYAGTYRFSNENTNFQLLRSIFSGRQLSIVRVTYPEGITLKDFASISAKKLGIDSSEFVHIANSDSVRELFKITGITSEGYLMPDTYEFFWEHPVYDIVTTLLEAQDKIWKKKFADKAIKERKSRLEVLTMASIIEAEARIAEERKTISGVYYNRIRKGWKLEADPTIQYILGHRERLTYKDLKKNSPYNTYKFDGLPPGPINSPSQSSIEAALNPEKHDFMYFVAVGDGSGRHNFSRSFSGHQQNRVAFKRNLKKQGR